MSETSLISQFFRFTIRRLRALYVDFLSAEGCSCARITDAIGGGTSFVSMHGSFILISVAIDFPVPNNFPLLFIVRLLHYASFAKWINVIFQVGRNGRIEVVPEGRLQNGIFRRVKTIRVDHKDAIRWWSKKGENRIIFLVSLADRKSSVANFIFHLFYCRKWF